MQKKYVLQGIMNARKRKKKFRTISSLKSHPLWVTQYNDDSYDNTVKR